MGNLTGATDVWNFTWFSLPVSLYDDIGTGLKVSIDIDTTHNYDYWAVTLAKSVLCVNPANQNECARDPTPGVPEPASLALMGLGLASLAAARRRKTA